MDFKQYYYVKKVADLKNFTKAAQELYISQPSLSAYIAKIEVELEILLFDRSTNPIQLTQDGELYLETYKKMIDLYESMIAEFDNRNKTERENFIVGIPGSRSTYMLPIMYPEFMSEFPNLNLEVIENHSMALIDALRKKEIDMAIMPEFKNLDNVKNTLIYQEELFIVTHKDVFKDINYISLEKLKDYSFFLLKKDHGVRRELDRLFHENNFKPNIVMETRNNVTALKLAVVNKGFAIVPKMTIEITNDIPDLAVYKIGKEGYYWNIVATIPDNRELTHIEKRFIEIMNHHLNI